MKNKIIKMPKIHNMLYMGLLIMIIKVYANASSILIYNDNVDTLLSVVGIGCLALHCLTKKYNIKTIIIYTIFVLLGLISIIKMGNYNIFITVVTCLAIREEPINKIINFIFKYECLFFVTHLIYALLRMVIINDSYAQVIDGVVRYDMGFGHPNRFSILLFNLLIMWIWLNFDRLQMLNIIIILAISLVSYMVTKTRTNEIALLIMLGLLSLYIYIPRALSRLFKIVSKYIVVILAGISMVASILYVNGGELFKVIDVIFSGRIRLGAYAYKNFGLTLLGRNLSNVVVKYDDIFRLNQFTFDNIYTDLCMQQGIIWLVTIILLFYKLNQLNNDKINFAIIAWAIYGITEVHGLNVYMLFPILLVSELFDKKQNIEKYVITKSNKLGENNDEKNLHIWL